MEKITCIAIDDDAPALRIIERYASKIAGLAFAGSFRNPIEGAAWINSNNCDILFLDIQMPQQTGIALLKELRKKPITIFTTAYSDFAADAFDLDAVDYIRKPFSLERFTKAVEKATDYLRTDLHKKSELVETKENEPFLHFRADGKLLKVFFSEIIYIEAYQEYIKIYTERGRFITYARMKNIERILPGDKFMRVHRSYIVALQKVQSVIGNLIEIDTHEIPVTRNLKAELLRRVF